MTANIEAKFQLPNGTTLKNRLIKAAMNEDLAGPSFEPSEEILTLYETWAKGGASVLITGNVMIDHRALGSPGGIVLENDRFLDLFRRWAQIGKENNTQIWLQLNHAGRQAMKSKHRTVAPSPVPLKGMGPLFSTPEELTHDEILDIIERFTYAAHLAEQAGFDGVQIHGAHGYLISQFLSPLTNLRTDAWGGSSTKRMKFLLELIRGIRAFVSPSFGVGLKLNSADFQRGGFTNEECLEVVKALNHEKLDFLEISGGNYEKPAMVDASLQKTSTQKREAYFLEYAKKIKEVATMPVMVTGGMRSRKVMDSALESEAIDLIGIARPLCIEPDLPNKLLSGVSDAAKQVQFHWVPKKMSHASEQFWYAAQIQEIGHTGKAQPSASRLRMLIKYGLRNIHIARKRRALSAQVKSTAIKTTNSSPHSSVE